MKDALKDQVSIITGGNAGIGKAIALKFAEANAKVILFGTNAERGKSAVEEIKKETGNEQIHFYQTDVSKTIQVDDVIKSVIDTFGKIDILVNNAGITADQFLMKMTEEEWDLVLNTNLKSCFNTCKAVLRSMMKARKGKIINITSVVGLMGNVGQANYAASKAGMIGFSKSLAKELASRNILVNCIAPGFIETAMTDKLSDQIKEAILKQIPLGRMGSPLEIAHMALFLASRFAEYITGQVFTVDGGMVM